MSLTPTVMVKLTHPNPRERERLAIEQGQAVARLARAQHGVVARRQLTRLGIGPGAIDWRLRRGSLRTVHRGVYAVGAAPLGQLGSWSAAVLACGESACLSHASAAALWGFGRQRGPIDVTAGGRPGRRGIRLHRAKVDADELTSRSRIAVTSVARTLLDLAETMDEERLESAWEEADRLGLLRLRAVAEVRSHNPGRRGLRPIGRLLAEARAPTQVRSPLEDRFQRFCRFYELPPNSTNVEVLGKEVDVLWPAAKLIVELDSWEFHSHRAAFQRDRARDTRLLVAGYRTARVTHERLDREAAALAGEIRALLRAQVVAASGSEQRKKEKASAGR